MMKNKEISIYIHIPFCERKCDYCAFVSFCASKTAQDEYVNFLVKEIEDFKTDAVVKTIYFGGGTPSVLSEVKLQKIFDALNRNFKFKKNVEITIEVNPNSLSEEKLKFYKGLGINRLSIGVQSLNDETLKKIGRLHNKEMAINLVKKASLYFDNISADLILGLENEKDVYKYAEILIDLGVKHISAYMLEVHKNTPIFDKVKNKTFLPLDDEEVANEYKKLVEFLKSKDFNQYEISNFALKGYESKHNLNYWTFGDYIGFGVSAHSYISGKRFANADNLKDYYKKNVIQDENNSQTEIEERLFLGLRCESGVDLKILKKLGYDITKNENYEKFKKENIIFEKNGKIFLNKENYLVSDYIISHLLPDDWNFRERMIILNKIL